MWATERLWEGNQRGPCPATSLNASLPLLLQLAVLWRQKNRTPVDWLQKAIQKRSKSNIMAYLDSLEQKIIDFRNIPKCPSSHLITVAASAQRTSPLWWWYGMVWYHTIPWYHTTTIPHHMFESTVCKPSDCVPPPYDVHTVPVCVVVLWYGTTIIFRLPLRCLSNFFHQWYYTVIITTTLS